MRRVALLCLVLAFGGGAGADQVQVQRMPDAPPGNVGLHGELRYSLAQSEVTAILSYVPTSQILFGTDYPFVRIETNAIELHQRQLTSTEMAAIQRDNILGLMPQLA